MIRTCLLFLYHLDSDELLNLGWCAERHTGSAVRTNEAALSIVMKAEGDDDDDDATATERQRWLEDPRKEAHERRAPTVRNGFPIVSVVLVPPPTWRPTPTRSSRHGSNRSESDRGCCRRLPAEKGKRVGSEIKKASAWAWPRCCCIGIACPWAGPWPACLARVGALVGTVPSCGRSHHLDGAGASISWGPRTRTRATCTTG